MSGNSSDSSYEFDPFTIFKISGITTLISIVIFLILIAITRVSQLFKKRRLARQLFPQSQKFPIIAFFHPQCDGGAGGEKVLYQAIEAIQQSDLSRSQILIYSGSNKTPNEILSHVYTRFGLEISKENLSFVQLRTANSLKPENYPSFTILWQAIYQVKVCFEALQTMPCDVFIDTMGVGFAYPFVKLFFGPKIFSYTHYPLVSYDMLRVVSSNVQQFNNRTDIASSKWRSQAKRIYYTILIGLYKLSGSWFFVDQIATNSSWTNNHILELWNQKEKTKIIYPPVDTDDLINSFSLDQKRQNLLISFAQFRPEKDHPLQLRIWSRVVKNLPKDAMFYLIGSVRDADDQRIVDELKDQAVKLGIASQIQFKVNLPRNELLQIFAQAKVGIHTMKDEHFGIVVVELMSSGIITIAHKSAGPLMDIIGATEDQVGFLAENEDQYVEFVEDAMSGFENFKALRTNARTWVKDRFSKESFNKLFIEMLRKCY